MKSFFEDHQVKRYSFNDKIKWIFEHYIIGGIVDDIIVPFDNISIKVTEKEEYYTNKIIKLIVIKGDNFEYSFPPDMTIEIWKSTKKVLRQCK